MLRGNTRKKPRFSCAQRGLDFARVGIRLFLAVSANLSLSLSQLYRVTDASWQLDCSRAICNEVLFAYLEIVIPLDDFVKFFFIVDKYTL